MVEGQCSYPGCTEQAIWKRKDGWMVAPGSPEGDVCETHHCWERIMYEAPCICDGGGSLTHQHNDFTCTGGHTTNCYPEPSSGSVESRQTVAQVSTHFYGDHCYPPHQEMP
jgi:hypothetical protein